MSAARQAVPEVDVTLARPEEPAAGSAPPTPSSVISMTASPPTRAARTVTVEACAYLVALASASEATK